jgi:hypothetical protein
MKKYFITLIIAFFFLSGIAAGQASIMQVGVRAGYRGGLFFQVNADAGSDGTGYMAMLGLNNGIQITGLRTIYETTISEISPDLFFVWGYGGHAGFIFTDHIFYFGDRYSFQDERFCPLFGVDGWLAAEYRFHQFPVTISLNIKPYVELTIPAFVRIMPWDIGLSAAYVF